MVQHVAHSEDLVNEVLLLLSFLIFGQAIPGNVEAVACLVLQLLLVWLILERQFHLLAPEQAGRVNHVSHQVSTDFVDSD